jgi:hypothetical protein
MLLLVRRYRNVRSQSTSKKWLLHEQMLRNPPTDSMSDVHMLDHTQSVTMRTLPCVAICLMRTLPCVAICRNATTRRAASNHVSLSPLPHQCGARWASHDRLPQCAAHHRDNHGEGLLPPSISSSGSPTILPLLLSRTCHAAARGTSWVVKVPGTTSTPASIMFRIGPARTTMYCGRLSTFVTTPVSPPITSGC